MQLSTSPNSGHPDAPPPPPPPMPESAPEPPRNGAPSPGAPPARPLPPAAGIHHRPNRHQAGVGAPLVGPNTSRSAHYRSEAPSRNSWLRPLVLFAKGDQRSV